MDKSKPNEPQRHIRDYLMQGGTLTVQQAFRRFHTTELRKVVTRLRRKGDTIVSRWTDGQSIDGRRSRYKVYYMIRTDNIS
ncbi:helix-turn-helix domain-containing protein [Alistipes communis]|jgi:hypothetical protein|uniref:Helix-turn-helix domain protein n=1 Tax=Siphoviridae sp. ctxdc10 TaxID=2825740 RepID=A0A8S5TSA5_9CAUD|nr:helix-turn-helix domain-containing protein [Alistipes communis]DAF85090.1 MAG TPA: helix-turn-helix domain protein [Siphoviridae sp. ctxdc10]DAP22712.1 MAG TPA: helix-turn-helix domain protein [Caudoviricetes sp.]